MVSLSLSLSLSLLTMRKFQPQLSYDELLRAYIGLFGCICISVGDGFGLGGRIERPFLNNFMIGALYLAEIEEERVEA